jgi:putative heme-binding domain-containing protein
VGELAANTGAASSLREAAFISLREVGGAAAVETLAPIAARESDTRLRSRAILALAGLKLDRAAAPAAALLTTGFNSENEALDFIRDFLKLKNSGAALAKALPKSGLPTAVAKAGLRAAREGGRNEPDLVLAFTRASGLDQGAATLTDAELRQLAADVGKKGDAARGESIYRRKDLACVNCHSIGGAGGKVGPDMTSLGASAPVDYLLESVWFPNKKIKEGFHSVNIETKDGEEYSGTLARETGDQLVLRDASAREVTIAKNNITNRRIGTLSLMPAGLIDNLSPQERIDLFQFLSELGKPGRYDASKGNIARVWRARTGAHTDEQGGEDKFVAADITAREWTPVLANVDGQLPPSALEEILPAPGYQRASLTALYVATRLEVAKAGPVKLKLTRPADAAVWIDGKLQKAAADLSADLASGGHTILVRLDPKSLPPSLRLETSEGTFSTN